MYIFHFKNNYQYEIEKSLAALGNHEPFNDQMKAKKGKKNSHDKLTDFPK